MSEVKVNKVSPRSGTTVTIGDSGDTINLVGTLQNNGSPLTGDISSVVAGTGLSGGATSGVATLNIEAAQPTITSLGTIATFRSTGIDDNATSTAITINSSEQVAIGSTNNGVGGAIDLSVGNTSSAGGITLWSTTTAAHSIGFADGYTGTDRYRGYLEYRHNGDSMQFATSATERMRITSAGLVGIGTSSPSQKLEVSGTNNIIQDNKTSTATGIAGIQLKGSNTDSYLKVFHLGPSFGGTTFGGVTGNNQSLIEAQGVSSLVFTTQGGTPDIIFAPARTARMTIKNDGKIGIGTASPAGKLDVAGTIIGDALQIDGDAVIQKASGDVSLTIQANENSSGREPALKLRGANSSSNPIIQYGDSTSYTGSIQYENADKSMQFGTNSSERMRIDSSGNVLVGKTSSNTATAGIELRATDQVTITRSGNTGLIVNRLSSDGSITKFQKDGTNVGEIGNIGTSGLVMGSGNIGLFFDSSAGEQSIKPRNSDGSARDNAIDLGRAAHRWRDIYLGGGAFLGGTGTANKLDDYEEGTWSPAIDGNTITTGFYTKVGRMCVATFGDATSNIPELTNGSNFLITGLPFGQIGSGWTYGSTPTASYADASASYHSFPLTGRQRNDGHIHIVNRSGQTKAANDPLNLCIVYQTN